MEPLRTLMPVAETDRGWQETVRETICGAFMGTSDLLDYDEISRRRIFRIASPDERADATIGQGDQLTATTGQGDQLKRLEELALGALELALRPAVAALRRQRANVLASLEKELAEKKRVLMLSKMQLQRLRAGAGRFRAERLRRSRRALLPRLRIKTGLKTSPQTPCTSSSTENKCPESLSNDSGAGSRILYCTCAG